MRLFRFDKTTKLIFAILLTFGFSTTAFAGGGGGQEQPPGCGKNDSVHCTGKVYRCLKKFGHTKSKARNPKNDKEQEGYCLPQVAIFCSYKDDNTLCYKNDTSGKCNMKEWKWNLDLKDDTVTETERSEKYCYFTSCELNGFEKFWYGGVSSSYHVFFQTDKMASDEPVDAYFYCAEEGANFNTIAKCVDKKKGEVAEAKKCDDDTMGTRYYYKPNCNTKEECNAKMESWDRWHQNITRFCYKPWEQRADANMTVYHDNAGGQTIRFPEFQYKNVANFIGPCEYSAFNKMELDWITDPVEPLGNLVILDKNDSKTGQITSRVHTKISGTKDVEFRIFEDMQAGKLESGLSKVTCDIVDKDDNTIESGEAVPTILANNAIGRTLARATGKSTDFIYTAKDAFKISGEYKIKCTGESKEGESREAEAPIFVAPHRYEFTSVQAKFGNSTYTGTSNCVGATDLICENLLSTTQTLIYSETQGKIEIAPKHNNKSWARKPVVKIGSPITISVAGMKALNSQGVLDTGVDESSNINGLLTGDDATSPNVFKPLGITNANTLPPTTTTQVGSCGESPEADSLDASIRGGIIDVVNMPTLPADVLVIKSMADKDKKGHAIVGEAVVQIYDRKLDEKIAEQENTGLCNATKDADNGNKFPCPYPRRLGLNFEYEIVPFNFKVVVQNDKREPAKVLYFGQGTSPAVEKGNTIQITALDNMGNTVTTFSKNCAAQNMKFQMSGSNNAMSGSGFYFELINKDGTDFVVKASDFENGVAKPDAIIKVQKDKDTPFTPAMKSEPVIIDSNKFPNGFPAEMSFAIFPAETTYYPKYEDVRIDQGGDLAILRARINSIDTDNGSGNSAGGSISPTKVWYEFQCEYCNLDEVARITGANYNSTDSRSPTQQGWWIDKTFGDNNGNLMTTSKMSVESGGVTINSVSPSVSNGLQTISYGSGNQGTHKLNILHGNFVDNAGNALAMPYFLLYNAYWNGTNQTDANGNTTGTLVSPTRWNTSSFIYVKGKAQEDKRNYGVDSGEAKNTRGGGRTGKF